MCHIKSYEGWDSNACRIWCSKSMQSISLRGTQATLQHFGGRSQFSWAKRTSIKAFPFAGWGIHRRINNVQHLISDFMVEIDKKNHYLEYMVYMYICVHIFTSWYNILPILVPFVCLYDFFVACETSYLSNTYRQEWVRTGTLIVAIYDGTHR